MKNKKVKFMVHLVVLVVMLSIVTLPVLAFTPPVIDPADPGEAGKGVETAGGKVAGLISVIGAAVAIVILIWLAIKYIAASPADKADIKKSAVPYVIGVVLLFAASGVLGIISSFGQGLFSAGGGTGTGGGESDYQHVQGGTEVTGTGEHP